MQVIKALVVKPANAGVGLYVTLRGTDEEIRSPLAAKEAKRVARVLGWDPDGRGQQGYPSAYGVGILESHFVFENCLCHGKYGCENVTSKVEWGHFASGSESHEQGAANLALVAKPEGALGGPTRRYRLSIDASWLVDAPANLSDDDIIEHLHEQLTGVSFIDLIEVETASAGYASLEPDFTIDGPEA